MEGCHFSRTTPHLTHCTQLYGPDWHSGVQFKGIKKLWCTNYIYFPLVVTIASAFCLLAGPLLYGRLQQHGLIGSAERHRH